MTETQFLINNNSISTFYFHTAAVSEIFSYIQWYKITINEYKTSTNSFTELKY